MIYALVPMMTGVQFSNRWLVNSHLWLWMVGSVGMSYAMGMAGSRGMLRRTLYTQGEFSIFTLIAIIGGSLIATGFIIFLVNLVRTLGVKPVLSLFLPERMLVGKPKDA